VLHGEHVDSKWAASFSVINLLSAVPSTWTVLQQVLLNLGFQVFQKAVFFCSLARRADH
jgi:hypothetical protein